MSRIWRGELEDAIGPVMAWVIPIFLGYIPGLIVWFMIFTLLITRYQELPLEAPRGDWNDTPCIQARESSPGPVFRNDP